MSRSVTIKYISAIVVTRIRITMKRIQINPQFADIIYHWTLCLTFSELGINIVASNQDPNSLVKDKLLQKCITVNGF